MKFTHIYHRQFVMILIVIKADMTSLLFILDLATLSMIGASNTALVFYCFLLLLLLLAISISRFYGCFNGVDGR